VDDHHLNNITKLKEKNIEEVLFKKVKVEMYVLINLRLLQQKKDGWEGKWKDTKVKKKTYPSQSQACKL
jgi:hypothetical protein